MRKLNNPMFLGLLFLGLQLSHNRVATAQELLNPPANNAGGQSVLGLPGFESSGQGSGTREMLPPIELPDEPMTNSSSANSTTPQLEPIAAGDFQQGFELGVEGEHYREFDYQPAILESTGTWLRRGFWYTEVDALLMDQIRERDNTTLMAQNFNQFGQGIDPLIVQGGTHGAEGVPRLKLGRFLFRDHKNRDHSAEFIIFGGGQWTKSGRLEASDGNTLIMSPFLESGLNTSFNGATSSEFDYDSRFNSVELNYHVKSRMKKDRMEMEPSGRWVRRAKPTISRSIMAGIRYFDLNEDFDWNALGIDADNDVATAPETGNFRVRTDNDLIGTQLGFSATYERARWSLGIENKNGIYWNHTNVDSGFVVTGGNVNGDWDIEVDNLSFLLEGALVGKYHIQQNFSIRAGLEILYISSLAQAAEQLNFVPVSTSQVVSGSDTAFMGALIGFEGYW